MGRESKYSIERQGDKITSITINGKKVSERKLRLMAENWETSDIRKYFEVSAGLIHKVLRECGIEKANVRYGDEAI